jgi:hypothetical protein
LLSDVFKIEKITGDMWAISTCLGFGSCIVHAIVTAAWVWIKE